jgi:hypothetical protein
VPRAAQHHRERPHPAPPPRPRVEPRAQVAVIHLRLLPGRGRRPPQHQPGPGRPLGEVRRHVPAHAGHADRQALLSTQPLPDHRHRDHLQQLRDPVMMRRDVPQRRLPQPRVSQVREPLPGQRPPLLRAHRRAARRHPGRLRRRRVLADRLRIHPQAPGDRHLRPARVPVLVNLRDVNHGERPPRHLVPPSRSRTKTASVRRTRGSQPFRPRPARPRENADRAGRELPDRSAPSAQELRDRQQPGNAEDQVDSDAGCAQLRWHCRLSVARGRRRTGSRWPGSTMTARPHASRSRHELRTPTRPQLKAARLADRRSAGWRSTGRRLIRPPGCSRATRRWNDAGFCPAASPRVCT